MPEIDTRARTLCLSQHSSYPHTVCICVSLANIEHMKFVTAYTLIHLPSPKA